MANKTLLESNCPHSSMAALLFVPTKFLAGRRVWQYLFNTEEGAELLTHLWFPFKRHLSPPPSLLIT
jgi:hypothetical protein